MKQVQKVTNIRTHSLADDNLETLTEIAAILSQRGFRPLVIIAERVGCPHELEMHNVQELDQLEIEGILRDVYFAAENPVEGRC